MAERIYRIPVTTHRTFFIDYPSEAETLAEAAAEADEYPELYEMFGGTDDETIDGWWDVDTDPAGWPSDDYRRATCPECRRRVQVYSTPDGPQFGRHGDPGSWCGGGGTNPDTPGANDA